MSYHHTLHRAILTCEMVSTLLNSYLSRLVNLIFDTSLIDFNKTVLTWGDRGLKDRSYPCLLFGGNYVCME